MDTEHVWSLLVDTPTCPEEALAGTLLWPSASFPQHEIAPSVETTQACVLPVARVSLAANLGSSQTEMEGSAAEGGSEGMAEEELSGVASASKSRPEGATEGVREDVRETVREGVLEGVRERVREVVREGVAVAVREGVPVAAAVREGVGAAVGVKEPGAPRTYRRTSHGVVSLYRLPKV